MEKLQYVDQRVIKLATEGAPRLLDAIISTATCVGNMVLYVSLLTGELEKLKDMSLTGYPNLNVCDKKGKSASYLAKKNGQTAVSEWLDNVGEHFVRTCE